MYSLKSLLFGIQNPEYIGRELNRMIYTRGKRRRSNPSGTYIFEEDWDNIIILDACRYDYYIKESEIPGTIDSRDSLGAATYEFIPANFSDQKLHDVIYLTANPQFIKYQNIIDIHDLIYIPELNLSKSDFIADTETISPKTVTRIAREINKKYPNKRLVIHYMQPHRPYIGPTGLENFDKDTSWKDVSDEIIRTAYQENLQIVLSEVDNLLSHLFGKTVITSDHGEMLGGRYKYIPMTDYGHWNGIYDDRLVTVPWHIIESDTRKDIVAEPPEREPTDVDVTERLKLLGYA